MKIRRALILRGFTLLETIVVIFIFSTIMFAINQLFISIYNSYHVQNAIINNSYTAASFLNETEELSLQADAIVASKVVSGTTYTTSSSTLILELPSINSSGDIISSTYDYAVITLSPSTTVSRILSANASSARISGTKKLSDLVNSITFSYDSATPSLSKKISIDIVTQTQVKQEIVQAHLTQQVYLRNK